MTQNISIALLRKLISTSPIFQGLDVNEVKWFISRGNLLRRTAGEILIHQNTIGHNFFLLLSGKLEIHVLDDNMEKRILNTVETMTIMGEIASITKSRRSANVECLEDCMFMEYTPKVFEDAEQHYPRTANKLYKNIISQISELYLKY